ncbi:hypothetical protein L9F63_003746, partial [Diploptera punctata]
ISIPSFKFVPLEYELFSPGYIIRFLTINIHTYTYLKNETEWFLKYQHINDHTVH